MFYSDHASVRIDQRHFRDDEVRFVVAYGKRLHRTGAILCQLYPDCLPDDLPANHRFRRLVGTTVMLCSCGQYVVTMYKNPRAFKRDRCKVKYDRRRGAYSCPRCGKGFTFEM
jgi:hypothetical protein